MSIIISVRPDVVYHQCCWYDQSTTPGTGPGPYWAERALILFPAYPRSALTGTATRRTCITAVGNTADTESHCQLRVSSCSPVLLDLRCGRRSIPSLLVASHDSEHGDGTCTGYVCACLTPLSRALSESQNQGGVRLFLSCFRHG